MAKADFKSVDEYIKLQPEHLRDKLEQVRRAIRKALPLAEESISYQIPAYKLNGEAMLYFAGWKQHYSLYPATDLVVTSFKIQLAPFKVQGRTIRFPLTEPVPGKLIEQIARLRAKEIAGHRPPKARS